jgi:hypothetical protein
MNGGALIRKQEKNKSRIASCVNQHPASFTLINRQTHPHLRHRDVQRADQRLDGPTIVHAEVQQTC